MIYVTVQHQKDFLAFNLPHRGEPFADILGSIGILIPPTNFSLSGTDQIIVKLAAIDDMGQILIDRLDKNLPVTEWDALCGNLEKAFPFGYENVPACIEIAQANTPEEILWLAKRIAFERAEPDKVREEKWVEMKDCPYLLGWHSGGETRLANNPEAVADFICAAGQDEDVRITDPSGRFILDTFGLYINKCPNQEYLKNELLPVLIPKQHIVEAQAFGSEEPQMGGM